MVVDFISLTRGEVSTDFDPVSSEAFPKVFVPKYGQLVVDTLEPYHERSVASSCLSDSVCRLYVRELPHMLD